MQPIVDVQYTLGRDYSNEASYEANGEKFRQNSERRSQILITVTRRTLMTTQNNFSLLHMKQIKSKCKQVYEDRRSEFCRISYGISCLFQDKLSEVKHTREIFSE